MSSLSITQQDKRLLDWIAIGESNGNYNAYHPSSVNTDIINKSISQIFRYQEFELEPTASSGAVGRYQFVRPTLQDTVKALKFPLNNIFSPPVQDYLIVQRLRIMREYNEWKSGSITDEAFMINLSKEFASVPVPRDMQGFKTFVKKGQSYYTGVGDNSAANKYDPDNFLQVLADIRTGGTGSEITFDPQTSTSPDGYLPSTSAEVAAGGGQRLRGGRGNSYVSELPAVSDPYLYIPPAAENNRYDFRTGKKVNNLLVNGVNPVSETGLIDSNGRSPVDDVGRDFYTAEQAKAILKNRLSIGFGENQVDPAVARAVGIVNSAGTTLPTTVGLSTPTNATGNLSFGKTLPQAPQSSKTRLTFGPTARNANTGNQ